VHPKKGRVIRSVKNIPNAHHCKHKISPLGPILSQFSPVPTFTRYFSQFSHVSSYSEVSYSRFCVQISLPPTLCDTRRHSIIPTASYSIT
jgi:hypothetical protein